MIKRLTIGAAAAALMVSGALAQTPNPSDKAPSAAPASPPAASSTAPADQSMAGKPNFVSSQNPDQWLASKFKGTDVIGNDEKKIGDVTDILFDKEGKIEAFIVSVGGFLGMGAKDVALAPTSFEVVKGTDGASDKLKLAVTQDELKQAQNFTPYQPPTTTGSAARPGVGAAGGMRPSSNTGPTGR